MKWGLQHVKVTLEESESGETIVIEQSSDGRVTCERADGGKRERAANTSPPHKPATRPAAATPQRAPAEPKAEPRHGSEEAPTAKAKAEPRAKTDAKKPHTQPKAGARKAPRKSLEWVPCKDHEYDGFAARSDAGQFKILITKGSQWALFYELKDTWPQRLGCFRKAKQGQKRAQELHDLGWPETEFGPVTAGQIAHACPAPRTDAAETAEPEKKKPKAEDAPKPRAEDKPTAPTSPKDEDKPAEDKPEPKGASKTDAEKDKHLLGSFNGELDRTLDEDDDEDD